MNISPLHPKLQASDVPMEQIAGNSMLTEDQKIGEATRQFEALLLRQILESTQKSVIQSDYSDDSNTAGIYRDMITNQLADSISRTGSLGLAQTLHREFTRQVKAETPSESTDTASTPGEPFFQSAKHMTSFSNLTPHHKEMQP